MGYVITHLLGANCEQLLEAILENPSTSYRIGKPRNSKIPPNIQKSDSPNTPSDTPRNTQKYEIRILEVFFWVLSGYFFDLLLYGEF